MELQYETYRFTPVLGWSISRYEVFDKCKRQYFYSYYSRYVREVPQYKVAQLKALTSVPLEIGNVVHDVLELFLRRLQKSDARIDEPRFLAFAHKKTEEYFSSKSFMEIYYGDKSSIDLAAAQAKVEKCLVNFLESPCFSWLFMKALTNRDNWMIEPGGYGETRLNGMKAYCKMDFLFPVDGDVHILDWKTGRRDEYKHSRQVIGYAAAAANNFHLPREQIIPKIVYLYPRFEEFEPRLKKDDFE